MNKIVKLTGIAAALAFSVSASADIIDLFTSPSVANGGQYIQTDGPLKANQASDADDPGSIIGGYRDLVVSNNGAIGNNDGICGAGADCTEMSTYDGVLDFGNESGVIGVGEVQWDGDDSAGNIADFDPNGLGSEDLKNQTGCPDGGCDAFVFTVIESDFAFSFVIGVYTDENNFVEFNLASNIVPAGSPETSVIPFSVFEDVTLCGQTDFDTPLGHVNSVTCGGTNNPVGGLVADLTDVGGLFIRINDLEPNGGTRSIDLQIGAIRKVGAPEPAMIGLMGLGLAAAGLVRIRNRRNGKA